MAIPNGKGPAVNFFSECARCLVPGPASLALKIVILLCIPAMIAGVVLVARLTKPGKIRDRTVIAVAIANPVLMIGVPLILAGDWPAHYSRLTLRQGAFSWPAGCVDRRYADGDQISIACHDYRNALPRKLVLNHGFPWTIGRTEQTYFRVGSDAVNFACNYFTDKCTVRHVETNVFS